MTVSTAFKAAKILREARDFIADSSHWVRLFFGMKDGKDAGGKLQSADRVCSLGAIGVVRDDLMNIRDNTPEVVFLACAISPKGNESNARVIINFNDNPRTTKLPDVLAAFDLATELAEKNLNSIPDKE